MKLTVPVAEAPETLASEMPVDPNATPEEQAAQWHVLVQSGEMDADDKRFFERWLVDEKNVGNYQRMEAVWGKFDVVNSEPAKNTLKHVFNENHKQKRKRRATAALSSAVLVTIFSVLGWQLTPAADFSMGYLLADYSTASS